MCIRDSSITINNGVISSSVGASVSTDDNAPSTPSDGDLWWDSVNGRLNVYYQDDNSSQWIDTSGIGSTSSPSTVYTIEALLSPGIQLLDDGNAQATNRIFFDGGTGISVVRTNTNPHTIEFKSSFAATLDNKSSSYTLVASDVGKTIKITSPGGSVNLALNIPTTFTPSLSFGDEIRILNGATESINVNVMDDTVTTLHWCQSASGAGGSGGAGFSEGDRQITSYALVTLTYIGNNIWNIHGDGIF